jgi:DNA-binding GntR family transcriptional regulator
VALAGRSEMRFRTKQEYVYRALRDGIVRCELRPGQRLVIDELARRLSVSAIPIREALQLLQSEGLVVSEPHVGATVAPLSQEAIREAFSILEGLETVAVRAAVPRLAEADLEALERILARMDEAVAAQHYERWSELNTRLHRQISRVAAMPLLLEMTERVLARWERLRRFYLKGVLVHRVEQAQREHRSLFAALAARDADAAERLVREHNRAALAAYEDYLRETKPGA